MRSTEGKPHEEGEVLSVAPERNLLTIGFFSPAKRNSRSRKEKRIETEIEIGGRRTSVSITIIPSAKYGLPTTADLDKYMALLLIASQQNPTIANPIYFRGSELLEKLGLNRSGANYRQIDDWVYRMFTTSIRSESYIYHARRAVWITDTVHVFERIVCAGQPLPADLVGRRQGEKSEHYIIWLPEWHRDNLADSYAVRLAYDTYIDLESSLAKTLLTLCAANLEKHTELVEIEYDQFCQLTDLNRLRYRSLVEKQLANAVEELLRTGAITNWELRQTVADNYTLRFYIGARLRQPHVPPQRSFAAIEDAHSDAPHQELTRALIHQFGVAPERAAELVRTRPEAVRRQLACFNARKISPRNLAGWIIRAIECDYPPPKEMEPPQKETQKETNADDQNPKPKTCKLCEQFGGFVYILDQSGYSYVRRCTHDPQIESKYNRPDW